MRRTFSGEGEEWHDVAPVAPSVLGDGRITEAPGTGFEVVGSLVPSLGVLDTVDRPERRHGLSVPP